MGAVLDANPASSSSDRSSSDVDAHATAGNLTTQNKEPAEVLKPMPNAITIASGDLEAPSGACCGLVKSKPKTKAPVERKVFDRPEPPTFFQAPLKCIAFEWLTPLLWNGARQKVVYDDLFKLPTYLKAESNYPFFENEFQAQFEKAESTAKGRAANERAREEGTNCRVLLRTIVSRHKWVFLIAMLLQCCATGLTFVNVVILNQLLGYMQQAFTNTPGISTASAYVLAAMLFVNPMINSLLVSHSNRFALGAQVRIRSELASALYRKALRLSSEAKLQTEVGKVVNLMSADITQIMTFCFPFLAQLLTAPLTIIGATIFMITQISWATFIGLAILLVTTPASGAMVTRIARLRREMLKYTDKRVKLMNQLLVGIRVIKMYAWEPAQTAVILATRKSELGQLGKMIPVRVAMQTMLFAAPTVAAVCSFLAYGAANPDKFTVQAIFTSIALFNLMRFPLIMLPFALVQLANAIVSMRRISHFLLLSDRVETALPMDKPGIKIVDSHFYWAQARGDAADTKDAEKAADKAAKKQAKVDRRASRKASIKRKFSRKGSKAGAGDATEVGGEQTDGHTDVEKEGGHKKAALDSTLPISKGTPVEGSDGSPSPPRSSDEVVAVDARKLAPSEVDGKSDKKGRKARRAKRGGVMKPKAKLPPVADDSPGGMDGCGRFHLQHISMEVKEGQLVCVVGRVGSGKSSLIGAVLGEMQQHRGQVYLGGSMAYAAQQAWIMNDTLMNNVLFGAEYDDKRWNQCLDACCLRADLEMLPGGVQTEIGEKGINLSGGQKQRVSLARAAYQDSDVYIFDDPLSAVDVHVGKHIFTQCMQGMLAGKTRLLVTNQLQYLPYADHIVFMEKGTIAVQGTLDQCMESEGFQRMIAEFNSKATADSDEDTDGDHPDPMFNDLNCVDGVTRELQPPGHAVLDRQETRIIRAEAQKDMLQLAGRGDDLMMRAASRNFTIRTVSDELPEPRSNSGALPDEFPAQAENATVEKVVAAHGGEEHHAAAAPTTGTVMAARELQNQPEDADEDVSLFAQHEGPDMRPTVEGGDPLPGPVAGAPTRTVEEVDTLSPLVSMQTKSSILKSPSTQSSQAIVVGHIPLQQQVSAVDGVEAAKRVFEEERRSREQRRSKEVARLRKSLEGGGKGGEITAATAEAASAKGKLMVKEDQEEGQVSGKVYWHYIKAFHVISFILLLCLWSTEQSLRILQNWWLSRWTTTETVNRVRRQQGQTANTDMGLYMGVYIAFCAGYVTMTLFRTLNNLLAALRASHKIHGQSLTRLVRAPVVFFDTTPVGRVLNRYSKDTDDMDYNLPQSISEFGNCIFQLAATIIFICVVQYWFIIGIVPLLCLYYIFQHYYRRSYIEMQRLDAVTRSPLYAHFSETLTGVETIRAYGAVKRFADDNQRKVDYNHRAYFNQKMGDEWLSIRLDLVGACITFMAGLLAVIYAGSRAAGILALTLTESLEVTAFLKYAVRAAAMFESRFNSVERLLAYINLQQEAPAHVPGKTPPSGWPSAGAIQYRNVSMRYRKTLDPVLRQVSFDVAPGDKVGIVGRTGSGKSSLIVTLFRMVEPYEGSIMLDGVELLHIGLADLRGRLAAIPQDPVLFSGSLRGNLDPFSKHNDAELWDALEQVALTDVVSSLPGTLDGHVSENGDNFSVGQRQLLCVARALLRKPQVLVADEATASVDGETDSLIQKTIRTRFAHCTVLTIAHRLNTILDSTKVLVMDAGKVKEYDTVKRLLSRRDSQFRSMVSEAGLLNEQDVD